jgi:hypothetical protein
MTSVIQVVRKKPEERSKTSPSQEILEREMKIKIRHCSRDSFKSVQNEYA